MNLTGPPALGAIVDAVIAFSVVEGLWLAARHRATGHGVAPRDYALNLVSGLCLMLALRAGIGGVGSGVTVLGWLAAAGVAHGTDLRLRWRRTPATIPPHRAEVAR
jgi:hypothetical protein